MSTADVSGINITVEPIDKFVLHGLQKKLGQLFSCTCILTQSTDRKRILSEISEKQGGLKYPYLFVRVSTITRIVDHATKAAVLNGSIVSTQEDGHAYRVHYLPVILTVETTYITNSAQNTQSFANDWLFARDSGQAAFNVNYGHTSFPVQISLDESVSLAERDASLDSVQEYQVTGSLSCRSWISRSYLVNQEVATKVSVEQKVGHAGAGDRRSLLDIAKDDQTTFWSFLTSGGKVVEEGAGPAGVGDPVAPNYPDLK